ncbi:MAG: PLDc_N domain-containing protein, partial [Firmicutes bacterium]|nr:PLDc_N domain-containing protein [Bacillota bacterium]
LMVTALIHVLRHSNYRFGSRAMWIPIVVFVQIIGPLVYFIFGRGVDE